MSRVKLRWSSVVVLRKRGPVSTNRFYIFHGGLREWEIDRDPPSLWPDLNYFSQVLRAFDGITSESNLRVIVTDEVNGNLPFLGNDVVVLCLRDELCRVPSYAHDVRVVAKTYGVHWTPNLLGGKRRSPAGFATTLAQESLVQVRRGPSRLSAALRTVRKGQGPAIVVIPLGTYMLKDRPFVPFGERQFDVSFAGSRVNRLKDAKRSIPTQKSRSRRELEAALSLLPRSHPDLQVGLHVVDTFHDAVRHADTYSELLMNSRIALCPRGGSLETYRYFEALRCGAVPVSERLPDRSFYTGAPGLRVRRWAELSAVLGQLLSEPTRLQRMHEEALRWWAERCSPDAVARDLFHALRMSKDVAGGDPVRALPFRRRPHA
ncbi:MAG TPA: glycosyltransferase [Chloroflexota bacterium]|nr:glycosyltransferase [Chloroflexota bacterium]